MIQNQQKLKLILKDFEADDKKSMQSPLNNIDTNYVRFLNNSKNVKINLDKNKSLKLNSLISSSTMNNIEKINLESKRRDKYDNIIKKGGKDHKLTFKENLVEIILIDSYKEYYNKPYEIKSTNRDCIECACLIF